LRPAQRRRRFLIPTFSFGKPKSALCFLLSLSALCALPAAPAGGLPTGIGAKYLENSEIVVLALQAFDFPQNGRRNLWKCLAGGAANLEMFGLVREKLATPGARLLSANPIIPPRRR
jgi:hypothetical protein